MKLSSAFAILAGALALFLAVAAGVIWNSIDTLRIGGANYQGIIDNKDAIADVLPPPIYVIEAYMTAHLAEDAPEDFAANKASLQRLKSEYEQRLAYWRGKALTPEIKAAIFGESDRHAREFWTIVENGLLPAIERGDRAEVEVRVHQMTAAFLRHQAAVNRIVPILQAEAARQEDLSHRAQKVAFGILTALSLAAIGLLIAAVLIVRKHVLAPLEDTTGLMNALANGDLNVRSAHTKRADEIGALANALEKFRNNAQERQRLDRTTSSQRDLESSRAKRMAELVEAFTGKLDDVIGGLTTSSHDLHSSAVTLDRSSSNASRQAEEADEAARNTSTHIQEIAAATGQLRIAVQEISSRIAESARISSEAEAIGLETEKVIEQLADAARQVEEVTSLISDVADQTNLLALNATIEAARAGQAGQGFAVVAAEVKQLATQTTNSTGAISKRIAEIQQVSRTTATGVRSVLEAMTQVREICAAVAAAVEEQAASTSDISDRAIGAARGASSAARGVESMTMATAEAGESSRRLLDTSGRVNEATDTLRREADAFFKALKAA
jgi:methyl-accepting chemotaxis protein